jgi:hypothetical protein
MRYSDILVDKFPIFESYQGKMGKCHAMFRLVCGSEPNRRKPVMLSKLFLDHPRSVEESYFEHALFAGRFALWLFALVHALIPCVFEKTASRMIAQMYAKTQNRGR